MSHWLFRAPPISVADQIERPKRFDQSAVDAHKFITNQEKPIDEPFHYVINTQNERRPSFG